MKKTFTFFTLLKRFVAVVIVLITTSFSYLAAQNTAAPGKYWNKINNGQQAPQTKLINSSEDNVVISVDLNGFYVSNVETPNGKASIISIPDMVSMLEKGNPDLPQFAIPVIIDDNAKMSVRITNSQYTDYEGYEIAPSKGNFSRKIDPNSVPYTYSEVYETNAFYPYEQAMLNEPYILRDYRGQNIMVTPIAYNPITKTLRVYHHLTIEMVKDGIGGENQFTRKKSEIKLDREINDLYNRHFINFSQAQTRYPVLEEEGNMLIICYGDYMEAAQPLVDWKKTTGRPTEMVNVADCGTTSEEIKAYVTEYYNDNGLAYLLLIGDHQHIPAKQMSGGYSDAFFSYISGNDSYNEFFVGRFSCENTGHVTTMVNRTIIYERDLNETDTWLNNGMGVAANEGAGQGHNGGEADYVHMDYIRDTLLHFTYATVQKDYTHTEGPIPGVPVTSSTQMSQHFNDGASIVNYCNHGSQNSWSVGSYSSNHVNALTNVRKWPVIWSVACDNGKFTNGTCFAEAWTRATHNDSGEPTGCVATMMSWISQPWLPPMTGQDEMVNVLTENSTIAGIKRTMGGTSIHGGMKMLDNHGSSGRSTHDTWLLFGDPSLMMRTAIPTPIVVSHSPAVLIGMNQLQVNADAEDALVALTLNGEILGTARVETGVANISFPTLNNVGTITVCIQAFNRITYLGEIDIIPAEGAFLTMTNTTINDELGNNNGLIDYGESISFGMTVKNVGVENAENITVTISTESQYITITQATTSADIVNANDELVLENAFAFEVNPNTPYKTNVSFNVLIESESDTWEQTANIYIHAPKLTLDKNLAITGALNQGETKDVTATIKNTGDSEIRNLVLNFSSPNPELVVNNPINQINNLQVGESANVTFSVAVEETTPSGYEAITYIYALGSETGFYTAEEIYEVVVGGYEAYNMSNETITTCAAKFYDNGGPRNNYSSSANITTTFVPATENAKIKVEFLSFATESGYDYLYIYNGSDATATQIGRYSGSTSPGTIIATNPEGTLTFKFTSDSNLTDAGWEAVVTCLSTDDLTTEAVAAYNEICPGTSTILTSIASGGSGSYTYSWAPEETLSDPKSKNPIATPSENTTYVVTVNDGSTTKTSEITININEDEHVVDLGTMQVIYQENNGSTELDATNENGAAYLWSTGETTPSITINAADYEAGVHEFSVTVFEANGCAAYGETSVLVITFIGVEENTISEIDLYPNPSNGNVRVELGQTFENGAKMIVYNVVGKIVFSQNVSGKSYDLSLDHLNNGVYFVSVQNDANKVVKRMIIQK